MLFYAKIHVILWEVVRLTTFFVGTAARFSAYWSAKWKFEKEQLITFFQSQYILFYSYSPSSFWISIAPGKPVLCWKIKFLKWGACSISFRRLYWANVWSYTPHCAQIYIVIETTYVFQMVSASSEECDILGGGQTLFYLQPRHSYNRQGQGITLDRKLSWKFSMEEWKKTSTQPKSA